jgi:Effector-associated domain 10/NACHT domain
MNNQDKIDAIIGRIIAEGKHTDADLSQLRELLSASDSESLIQFGKNIVGKIYGQDIQIGDRIYQGADAEAIRQELRSVLQELRLVLQEKQKADAEAIREALRLFLEELRSVLQKPRAERPNPENQLLEKVKGRIEERLKELPHNVKPINLDKEWRQDQVQHPDGVDLSSRYTGKIREDCNIFDILQDAKKLLILGEPGAGKTTTMLVLAKALINQEKEQSNSPIPVLLELSSWKKEQITMIDWLVDKLDEDYGCAINKEDVKEILIGNKLLLMLDGLDELEESSRKECVSAINNLLKPGDPVKPGELVHEKQRRWQPLSIVICSRRQEYETLGFKLQLNRAICLKDLSPAQIKKYLADRDKELRKELSDKNTDKNSEKLRDGQEQPLFLEFLNTLERQDPDQLEKLLNVLQRPLFLKKVYDAMKPIIDKLNNFNSLEHRQPYLSVLYYMQSCLQPEKNDFKKQTRTIGLLIWLAKQLQIHSKTEFYIEKMQPSWLPFGTRKWYVLLVAVSIFLILLIPRIGFIYYTQRNFYISDRVLQIIALGVIAVSASLHQKIKIFEKNIVNATLCNYLNLSFFWRKQENCPNQGILNAAMNTVCIVGGIAIIFPAGLSIHLIQTPDLFFSQFIDYLLRYFLCIGLIVALVNGCLKTSIQHFILRLILRCHGHPCNYAEFLDNAVQLKLLRRVGGRYEFIHSPLKECFAILHDIEMAPNTEETDCAS